MSPTNRAMLTRPRTRLASRLIAAPSRRDLQHLRLPLVDGAIDDVERVRVDDERPVQLGDVEELERLRRRAAEHDRGVLVMPGAVARTVEAVIRRDVRHRAPEVRALAVRRDDPTLGMEEEEAPLDVEDRRVLGRAELREQPRLRADRDLRAEPDELVHPEERHEQHGDLGEGEEGAAEEAEPQELPAFDLGDQAARGGRGVLVRPDHAFVTGAPARSTGASRAPPTARTCPCPGRASTYPRP